MEVTIRRAPVERDNSLMLLLGGPAFFQAMATAHEVGLFAELSARPGSTFEALEEALDLPDASLRILLMTLCALELTHRSEDGRFRNAPWVNGAFGAEDGSFIAMVEAFQKILYGPFGRMTEALVRGTNAGLECFPGEGSTLYERLQRFPETEAIFHRWMSSLSAFGLPGAVLDALRGCRRVLDVGGGDGTNALLLAKALPHVRITLLDLPTITARAREKIEEADLQDRIETLNANIRDDDLPEGVDGILFSRIFNIYGEAQNAAFVRRSFRALEPGGVLVVHPSLVADDDETGPLAAAFLSLYFACLATGDGRVYPVSSYAAWFRAAGFASLAVTVDERNDAVIVGTKAGL